MFSYTSLSYLTKNSEDLFDATVVLLAIFTLNFFHPGYFMKTPNEIILSGHTISLENTYTKTYRPFPRPLILPRMSEEGTPVSPLRFAAVPARMLSTYQPPPPSSTTDITIWGREQICRICLPLEHLCSLSWYLLR